jgi:Serine/threonine protein phosphatase
MIFTYGLSLPGKSHITKGMVCQDSHCINKTKNGWIIAAIADGVGSAKHSDVGSKIAAEKAVLLCNECLPVDQDPRSIKSLIGTAFNYALKCIYEEAEENKNPIEDYDTTLTLVIYDGARTFYGHAGDSGIIGLTEYGEYKPITVSQKGEGGTVIPLRAGRDSWDINMVEGDKLISILLVTDGILDQLIPYKLREYNNCVYIPLSVFFMDSAWIFHDAGCLKDINVSVEGFLEGKMEPEDYRWCLGEIYKKYIADENLREEVIECIMKSGVYSTLINSITDDKTVVGIINLDEIPEPKDVCYYAEPDWHKITQDWSINQEEKWKEFQEKGSENVPDNNDVIFTSEKESAVSAIDEENDIDLSDYNEITDSEQYLEISKLLDEKQKNQMDVNNYIDKDELQVNDLAQINNNYQQEYNDTEQIQSSYQIQENITPSIQKELLNDEKKTKQEHRGVFKKIYDWFSNIFKSKG